MDVSHILDNLNDQQRHAVASEDQNIMVLAGAGSGKTRVLTTKLAYIISEKRAWPNQILCVTFTNKAAKEMQNRVMQHIKGNSNAIPWLGTFHSICAKIPLFCFNFD